MFTFPLHIGVIWNVTTALFGGPNAEGVFTFRQISEILAEAKKLKSVDSVSIEGGEPFLYYQIMVKAVMESLKLGFRVEVLEPLIRDGPAALVEKFNLPHSEAYADACHLCYQARCMLRNKFPEILTPNQMYGKLDE